MDFKLRFRALSGSGKTSVHTSLRGLPAQWRLNVYTSSCTLMARARRPIYSRGAFSTSPLSATPSYVLCSLFGTTGGFGLGIESREPTLPPVGLLNSSTLLLCSFLQQAFASKLTSCLVNQQQPSNLNNNQSTSQLAFQPFFSCVGQS